MNLPHMSQRPNVWNSPSVFFGRGSAHEQRFSRTDLPPRRLADQWNTRRRNVDRARAVRVERALHGAGERSAQQQDRFHAGFSPVPQPFVSAGGGAPPQLLQFVERLPKRMSYILAGAS